MTESRNRLMATVLLIEIALHSRGSGWRGPSFIDPFSGSDRLGAGAAGQRVLTPEADLEVADA
jgi:hypothetical protein